MKILAIIMDPEETKKILRHLAKIGRPTTRVIRGEVPGYRDNLNHPYIEVDDTAIAVIRFRNGALGSIVVSNSQRPGIYGKVHVHGKNGASVGVQTTAIYRSNRNKQPVIFPLKPEEDRDDFDGRLSSGV